MYNNLLFVAFWAMEEADPEPARGQQQLWLQGFWSQVTGQQDSASPQWGGGHASSKRHLRACSWASGGGGVGEEATGSSVPPFFHL